jgi:hypothetical protein
MPLPALSACEAGQYTRSNLKRRLRHQAAARRLSPIELITAPTIYPYVIEAFDQSTFSAWQAHLPRNCAVSCPLSCVSCTHVFSLRILVRVCIGYI